MTYVKLTDAEYRELRARAFVDSLAVLSFRYGVVIPDPFSLSDRRDGMFLFGGSFHCWDGERYVSKKVEASGGEERERVECDGNCGAYEKPQTLEEYKAALGHWRNHSYLSGCAHAR